ncbi:MAG: glycosyltransferase family 4 protein [Acidimicrobiia bacterium]|nr:glycosyltransferase family 4 protein [Acidimicrobiia bacterium]
MLRVMLVLDSVVEGGAERSTAALLPYLTEREIDVELAILHDRPGLQDRVTAAGIPLHRVPDDRGRRGWITGLRALIDARRPDLVHTSLYQSDLCGRIAAASKGVPVVSTLATESYAADHLGAPHLNRVKVRATQIADAGTARLTRRLHAVSSHVADRMAVHLRYPREHIDVVYRGRADVTVPDSFDRTRFRRELGVDHARGVVLVVARHEYVKGIDRVLAALPAVLAAHPETVLLVAGREGQHTSALERCIADAGLGDAVRLLGHRPDVDRLLAVSDAFVLGSRREGLPGSLIEAMASGTPAIATDLPQVREVATCEQALLVDAGEPAELAAALVESLADRTAATARAARARQRFLDRFTIDRSADGMVAFYRRALAQ